MTKSFVTLFLVLLLFTSIQNFGQDKPLREKAPLKTEPVNILQYQTEIGTQTPNTAANYVAVDLKADGLSNLRVSISNYSNSLASLNRLAQSLFFGRTRLG